MTARIVTGNIVAGENGGRNAEDSHSRDTVRKKGKGRNRRCKLIKGYRARRRRSIPATILNGWNSSIHRRICLAKANITVNTALYCHFQQGHRWGYTPHMKTCAYKCGLDTQCSLVTYRQIRHCQMKDVE